MPDSPYVATRSPLSRRAFLRGTGAVLSLPFLDAMRPTFARAATDTTEAPKRLMAVCNNLGFVPDKFFPADAGREYTPSAYLEELAEVREHFTVLDGVSHPGVNGSHASDVSFLTAAPGPGTGGFKNSISLDQHVAERMGAATRFTSLTLGVNAEPGRRSLSWTTSGVLIPCEDSAATVYRHLFLRGAESEVEARLRELRLGRSILDAVGAQSSRLRGQLGARDQERLEQFETAVRDVERRLHENEAWAQRPKPEAPIPQPSDPSDRTAFMRKAELMYRMANLAFETDSTRAITLLLDATKTPKVGDLNHDTVEISDSYHNLSHHGRNEEKLAQLEAIDRAHMGQLKRFLLELRSKDEGASTLLDNTAVLFGSNLGDANKHTTNNMPMLVAGGRFQHGQVLRYDRDNNEPLANLFVSVLQQMGFEEESFATGTRPLTGLDLQS